ncbi:MAG: cyclic nucleotide-binding domain-containing protein, partial [Anaerolineales bacterium]|nr:cyclic nucleotide-binding domain-containing protein [Anaerolineales bacterium]
MTALKITESLKDVTLFKGMTEEEMSRIAGSLYLRDFPANAMLITEGQPGEVVYVILSGTVKVFSVQPDGNEVIISIVG